MAIRLLILTCLFTVVLGLKLNNGTAVGSEALSTKERFRRLIPYMTFYLGQSPNPQYRPSLLHGKDRYNLPYQQPVAAVPVLPQPQYSARPINYVPRYVVQQQSPLTKMITDNYLAISKQQQQNQPRFQTRLNLYPSQSYAVQDQQQYKQLESPIQYKPQLQEMQFKQQPTDELVQYKQQQDDPIQYKPQQDAPIQYKQQQELPIQYKQIFQDAALHYGPKQQVPIRYKPQLHQQFQYKLPVDTQYKSQIQASPFKASPQITEQVEYRPLNEPVKYKTIHEERFNVQDNQPTTDQTEVQHQEEETFKPAPKQVYIVRPPQYRPQQAQDDSVTITQSQEIDVQPQPLTKYHATYQAKPTDINNYPISYQQQTEYEREELDDVDKNLNNILDGVSISKSLPERITPENLDSSIRTLSKLLRILQRANALPHSAKEIVKAFPRPVEPGYSTKLTKLRKKLPYKDDDEGGTPGKAGVDYPAYDEIPPTSFSCKTQRYKGFFGDPDTGCQVWHYCDLNGGQASFLCPNGTIFSQIALTCDWWFNVKCDSTTQLYVLNERLYKYILPHKPKFPEDFSGPLVDHYLSLKFEEKSKNETENASKEEDSSSLEEEEEAEAELPYSLDDAAQNKVRSIPN